MPILNKDPKDGLWLECSDHCKGFVHLLDWREEPGQTTIAGPKGTTTIANYREDPIAMIGIGSMHPVSLWSALGQWWRSRSVLYHESVLHREELEALKSKIEDCLK